jgi:hypothetical protein
VDPFPNMGTPVAYLVDDTGLVAEPFANGAGQVPALLRRSAGIDEAPAADHDHEHGDGHEHDDAVPQPKFVPAPSAGVCGPGAPAPGAPTVWEPAHAYRVGDVYVGVKANTPAADAVLARVLAPIRNDELDPPANYSIVLAGDGDGDGADGVRGLHMLLRGTDILVRSRSEARVIHGLLQYLSGHAPSETGLMFTSTVVAVVDDHALLLPRSVQSRLKELQPRLSRAGIRIADVPVGLVDLATREVVVAEPAIAFDAGALGALADPAARGSELARVQPGRYRLTAWCFANAEVGAFSAAKATAKALSLSLMQVEEATMVASLVDLFGAVPGVGVGSLPDDDMVAAIKADATGS